MPNKNIYLDFSTKKLTDSSGNTLLPSDKPTLLYQAYELWQHKFLTGSTGIDVSNAVSWSFAVDNDFEHILIQGECNGSLTGAITAIAIKELASEPPTAGILHLANSTSETDSVLYSSWTLANSIYTFAVNATLAHSYSANDICEIEDTAPMVRVNDEDIDKSQAASGIINVQVDAETIIFLSKLGSSPTLACYARLRGYNAQGKPIYNYRYDIIAENDIDPSNLNPPGPANKWLDASQIYGVLRSAPVLQFSPDGATAWSEVQGASEYFNISYTGGETSDAIHLPTGATGAAGVTGAAATLAIGAIATLDPGATATASNLGTTHAAILNLAIPRGTTGAQGIQGIQGEKGDTGATGADSTVIGPVGPVGPTGAVGATGLQGVPGPAAAYIEANFTAADLVDGILTITHVKGLVKGLPGSITLEGVTAGTWENINLDDTAIKWSNNQILVDLAIYGLTGAAAGYCAFGGAGTVAGITQSGASNFLDLLDSPDSYTDQAGKLVAVKSDGSGLEFVDGAIGVGYTGDVIGITGPTGATGAGTTGAAGATGATGATGSSHVSTRSAKGNISGAVRIDRTNGDYQVCTTTATTTGITISNLTTETGMILRINNSDGYAVTFNSTAIIATSDTGNYACAFYNDNGTVCYMGKGRIY